MVPGNDIAQKLPVLRLEAGVRKKEREREGGRGKQGERGRERQREAGKEGGRERERWARAPSLNGLAHSVW